MRPTYETEEDKANQLRVISLACPIWKCDFRKSDPYYPIDFFLVRGEGKTPDVVSVAEVKCRKHDPGKYDTLMVSAEKWLKCVEWDRILKIPFVLVVEFLDGSIHYCRHRETPVLVRWGGRQDRDDPKDMEPVVHIPMSEFKLLRAPA